MTTINKSALVLYTPEQMYKLVNEVELYPEFMPWCRGSVVHERDELSQRASVEIAKGPINKTFTTKNTMSPNEQIILELVDGPFKSLQGKWSFVALGDKGCKISMNISFEFSSQLVGAVLNPIFSEICNTFVDAFVKRANVVY